MSPPSPRRTAPRNASLLVALALLLAALPVCPAPRAAAAAAPQAAFDTTVRVYDLSAGDLVYNAQSQKIVASLPAENTVAEIDPATGAVGETVFVGSEPGELALADDGQTLYVGLDGAAAVRRVDLATHTAGLQFPVGFDPNSGKPFHAADMDVAPGDPDVVAVARRRHGGSSPPGGGVAVYDNGVQRPGVAAPFGDILNIDYGATASTLYGVLLGRLHTMSVGGSGVTGVSTSTETAIGGIQFANGLVYETRGRVINPATNSLVGTFAGANFGPFYVDEAAGRAYYIVDTRGPEQGGAMTFRVRAYDTATYAAVGEIAVEGVVGVPYDLVRWGANGLAFRDGARLYVIQSTLVDASEPVPTPTPTPTATPTPTPTPQLFEVSVKQVRLTTNDLVYHPSSNTLYASVPSSAGAGGNSVVRIDPETAASSAPVFVGSEPNQLAVSDDGQYVYVGLDGARAVRRFDVATGTPGPQFSLGADANNGPFRATDIEAMPGSPLSVAVAMNASGPAGVPSSERVAVYDDGVQRPDASGGAGQIEFGATPSRLYAGGGLDGAVFKYGVVGSGLTFDGSVWASGRYLVFDGGLLYSSDGLVIEPETGTLKGTFAGASGGASPLAVDAGLGRAYFLNGHSLRAYDINTFLPIGAALITGLAPPTAILSNPVLVRWGQNGLAFRTSDHVVIIQSTLVNPAGAGPTPTPIPTATPTPTPTPAPPATLVKQFSSRIGDFALSSATQKLYVSLPSTVGAGANGIVEVDPETGAATGPPVPVGTEPGRLAISGDGQVVWAYLDGPRAVRRFDVATQTPGLQFSLGGAQATDLEVMPGTTQTVAVATGATPRIYDNGVERPAAPNAPNVLATAVEFSSDPATLYGSGDPNIGGAVFYRMTLGASGVEQLTHTQRGLVSYGFSDYMRYVSGRMYMGLGRAFNPDTLQPLGIYQGGGVVAVDTALKRVFYATGNNQSMTLRAYDLETFLPLGEVRVAQGGMPLRLERFGEDGLALSARPPHAFSGVPANLFLIRSALVSSDSDVGAGVAFAQQAADAWESAGSVAVKVVRTGDLSGAATVEYKTSDGTATERGDYTTALGTLRFEPGESQKTIRVLLSNDAIDEVFETFDITLSGASGAQLSLPEKLTVTILDDDSGVGVPNPIDSSEFFVRQHYHDFLNREPDAPGLTHWTNEIEQCGADAPCREVKRINVSAAFFLSIEFQETGYFDYLLYKAAFNTGERVLFQNFAFDTSQLGRDVVVGAEGWEQQLSSNKQAFVDAFAARSNFLSAYPQGITPEQFVDALNANTGDPLNPSAGGALSKAERDQLAADLTSGAKTRAQVLRAVAENAEFRRRQLSKAFVLMQYFGYLRRAPNAQPDTNFDGYNFWLGKLNEFNGDYIQAEMVKAFITSDEYRKRFGQ